MALSGQLQSLQNLKGRKYDDAKQAEGEWEQLTEKILIRAFGSDSPNVRNFHQARWAGEHQIVPYDGGIPHGRLQRNYDERIQAYETVVRSCLAELKLVLPEAGGEEADDGRDKGPRKIEVRVAESMRTSDRDTERQQETPRWDAFICHASEDKENFVHPLAELLTRRVLKVWYDKFTLKVGDSLRQAIDLGLSHSRFGIVVLSPSFFEKQWPKQELDGLVAREVDGRKVILPVWHKVSLEDVTNYSPMLAGRYAAKSKDGLEVVAGQLIDAMKAEGHDLMVGGNRETAASTHQPKLSAQSSTLIERPKRGRRTITDSFLLGARNAWAALLEESWPEIGWSLSCIRDRRNSTIEDVRKAFEPVKRNPHNSGLPADFYHESFETAKAADIRKNGEQLGKLHAQIHHTRAKYDELERSCREAEAALKMASTGDADTIKEEAASRLQRLHQLGDDHKKLLSESEALDKKFRDQKAYVSRSELLDFLLCRAYALNPRNLANALAGLPLMKWRQSFSRCSSMSFNEARLHYRVFEVISNIWGRQSKEFEDPPVEPFRAQLLKLPRKLGYARQFLWDNWSDLRLAIEECWKSKQPLASIPFVLTSIFMRNATRQKNPAERVLAEREKLGS